MKIDSGEGKREEGKEFKFDKERGGEKIEVEDGRLRKRELREE